MKTPMIDAAILLTVACTCTITAESSTAVSPYGICAHVSRRGEHQLAQRQFQLMRQAGIRWCRTDFDWTSIQHEADGPWTFDLFDETVDWAQAAGVEILPILDYDTPWARPAYKHLDAWLAYVRATVGRYQNRLRYWEVWNEPNLKQFWREDPDPAAYAALLKPTCQAVKRIDPDLQVLIGGCAGIPLDFIEGVYKAGGRDFFDIMNVHPYRYPAQPDEDSLYDDLIELRTLMARYGDADKPIWITEIGWPTHRSAADLLSDIVRIGLKTLASNRTQWTLAVLDDPDYLVQNRLDRDTLQAMLPGQGTIESVLLKDLQALSAQKFNALLLPPDESFPADVFDGIEDYVRHGGILILGKGVPLYYTVTRGPDGRWIRGNADESWRRRLHIGWEAWWTRSEVPQTIGRVDIPEGLTSDIRKPDGHIEATRFLTRSRLKPGDKMTSLLTASTESYKGVVAAAYDLDSDLKGGLIVTTLGPDFRGVTPEEQAAILPKTYLLAMQAGVEPVFWYNLRANENEPTYNESHFGIVHRDLSPKPAYRAMQTLARMRPAGSQPVPVENWRKDGLYRLAWKRPDGQTGWSLWDRDGRREHTLAIRGRIRQTCDHQGEPVPLKTEGGGLRIQLDRAPIYLIGPTAVTPR